MRPSFHSVERFLQYLDVGSVAGFFAAAFDPFFLQRVFGWAIGLVEDAEDAGEGELGQLIGG